MALRDNAGVAPRPQSCRGNTTSQDVAEAPSQAVLIPSPSPLFALPQTLLHHSLSPKLLQHKCNVREQPVTLQGKPETSSDHSSVGVERE